MFLESASQSRTTLGTVGLAVGFCLPGPRAGPTHVANVSAHPDPSMLGLEQKSRCPQQSTDSENHKNQGSATGMPRRLGRFPIQESNVFVRYNNIVDRSGTVRNLMFLNIELS